MKKHFLTLATALFVAGAMFTSCANDPEEAPVQPDETQITTRAYGDKSPIVSVYVEINDNDPRIVTSYKDGNGKAFIDLVHLFAANVNVDSDGHAVIYFNDKMAPMFADFHTYLDPIKAQGTKVLLTILPNWQHKGMANMDVAEADRFADILTYIVDTYQLDGISFDDEYADYYDYVDNSYSYIIKALRAKLDTKFGAGAKLITVFQWGNYGQIDAAAGAMLDYADHGTFGANVFYSSSSISGMTNDRWMPQAIQLGNSYNALTLNQIKNRSSQAASGNYGGIMMFNMRRYSERSPLPVFQKIAEGAFGGTVTYDGTDYTRSWTPDPNGYTITKNDVPAYQPTFTGN